MTHPLVSGPLPAGWSHLGPTDSATITERLLAEQPRMALLTQGLMCAIARHDPTNTLLVQCEPHTQKFFATFLKGRPQSFLSSHMVSVSSATELATALPSA